MYSMYRSAYAHAVCVANESRVSLSIPATVYMQAPVYISYSVEQVYWSDALLFEMQTVRSAGGK